MKNVATLNEEKMINFITQKVIEIQERERQKVEEREKNNRLRNVKILLRNYRTLKNYAQRVEGKKVEELEEINVSELFLVGEDLVKSITQTSKRTLIMIRHVDQALDTLKYIYSLEKHPGTRRQYDILHARYIDGMKIEDIAEEHEINDRSVYKSMDAAIERLSIILFGVYGLRIE